MNGIFELRADRRRKNREVRPNYDPIALNERHQEILNLAVLGLKGPQIAEALGVSLVTVNNTINSTLGREKMGLMRAARDVDTLDVAKKMQEIIPKALRVYEKILDEEIQPGVPGAKPHAGASLMLQKQTADKVLENYSGMVVPKKVMVGHAHLTAELLEEIKAQGRKAAEECGLLSVIDIVPQEG